MTDNELVAFLVDGLRNQHDTAHREKFLREVWHLRNELADWLERTDKRFVARALPIFLHGGSSAGKVVVMGINPGWRPDKDERLEQSISRTAETYASFHESFFHQFPKFEAQLGSSSFWNNLRSKLVALRPEISIPLDKWQAYQTHLVVQDLFPFHSWKKLTNGSDVDGGVLGEIAEASFDGLVRSEATEVWAFSPEAHRLLARMVRKRTDLAVTADTFLEGCTSKGNHRRVHLLVASAARPKQRPLRFIALDNALLTQPWFSFDKVFCSKSSCHPKATMARQILDACGDSSNGGPLRRAVPLEQPRPSRTADETSAQGALLNFGRSLGSDVSQLPPRASGALVLRRRRNFVTVLPTRRILKMDVLTDVGWRDGVAIDPGIGLAEAHRLIRRAYELAN